MISLATRPLIAVLLALGLEGCAQPNPIAAELQAAKKLSVPWGASVTNASPTRREGERIRATWDVETGVSWEAYRQLVTSRFEDYRVVERGEEGLSLTRRLARDSVSIALARGRATDGRLIVSAAFEATPF